MYEELTRVIDEARLMIHRTVAAIERLHTGESVTVPMRAVLEYLLAHGPHTVSAIARARSVTRQHIQTIVNELLDAGLVARLDNPNHRRAALIDLTDGGAATIERLHARERAVFEPALSGDRSLTPGRLSDAASVLRSIGAGIDAVAGSAVIRTPASTPASTPAGTEEAS